MQNSQQMGELPESRQSAPQQPGAQSGATLQQQAQQEKPVAQTATPVNFTDWAAI